MTATSFTTDGSHKYKASIERAGASQSCHGSYIKRLISKQGKEIYRSSDFDDERDGSDSDECFSAAACVRLPSAPPLLCARKYTDDEDVLRTGDFFGGQVEVRADSPRDQFRGALNANAPMKRKQARRFSR